MKPVLDLLARERGVRLDERGWQRIAEWRDWWMGEYKPFHRYRERTAAGGVVERPIYSMRMAKKICEDWSSILLGEHPEISVPHTPSRRFLLGEDGRGGVLGDCRFWQHAAALIELAFYSGTGAMVLRLQGVRTSTNGRILPGAGKPWLQCLPATNIVPLTVHDGDILEAAFCSETLENGRRTLYLETHTLENGGYVIENRCLRQQSGGLYETDLPEGVARRFVTGSSVPLFCILRPGGVGAGMPEGMGEAVFAGAIDNLKGVDLAFHNFCRDFLLGGKKVFYNRSLLQEEDGMLLAPDDVCQQLFLSVGDKLPGEAQLIYEHNPALRVQENIDGLQAQLDYLSLKCGLGAKYYRFDAPAVTATQYVGDRQELVRSAARHGAALQSALWSALRMLLWAGRAVCGAGTDEDCGVCVRLDDSVIMSRESLREQDRADVAAGLLLPHEYRMRWYGETREEAVAALSAKTERGETNAAHGS